MPDTPSVDTITIAAAAIYAGWYNPATHMNAEGSRHDTLRKAAVSAALQLHALTVEATSPPANVDAPYVSQAGTAMNATMGNWRGEPTGYAYQWQRDGTNIGADAPDYPVTAPDIGRTLSCVVTATNAIGSTVGPPSNGVVAVVRSRVREDVG
jgi:hypothetical protein